MIHRARRGGTFDQSAVDRDDALLDALRRGETPADGDEVTRLLAAWHNDVAEAPGRACPRPHATRATLVDLALAMNRRRREGPRQDRRSRRHRMLRRTTVAVATAAALSVGGVSAAERAQPGGLFWPLTRIIDGERADSLIAQREADRRLQRVRSMLHDGRLNEAADALDEARHGAAQVRPQDGQHDLREAIDALDRELAEARSDPGDQHGGASPSGGGPPPASASDGAAGHGTNGNGGDNGDRNRVKDKDRDETKDGPPAGVGTTPLPHEQTGGGRAPSGATGDADGDLRVGEDPPKPEGSSEAKDRKGKPHKAPRNVAPKKVPLMKQVPSGPQDGSGDSAPRSPEGGRRERTVSDPAASDPAASDPAANDPAANDPAANDPAANDGRARTARVSRKFGGSHRHRRGDCAVPRRGGDPPRSPDRPARHR